MHPITLAGFAGSNLATNPRLLAETVGVYVVDAEPGLGDLRPLHDRLTVASVPASPQRLTIYREGRDTPNDTLYWLSWSTIVSVIRGFDGTDPTERIYFMGSGTAKWTDNILALGGGPPYPQADRELSVPAPITAPITTLTTDGTGTEGVRFYVSTFVNDLGWESAPSPPSVGLTCKTGAIVAVSALPAAPAGNYGITLRRIYRTQPGDTGSSAFLFHSEIPIGSTSMVDNAEQLGEELPTVGWLPPPVASFGLIALWNEMAAAISDKAVIFCEPGELYAWPVKYDFPVTNRPVALAKWEQNLLVLTTGAPVLLNGQSPDAMSEIESLASGPCRAARSVVEFEHGVCWASNEGLAYTGAASLLTLNLLTPRQWKALRPETIVAGRWGRFYVASYNDGTGRKGFMFDPLQPGQGIWWLSSGFDACWYDDLADTLYVLEGGSVRKFDGAAGLLTARFKSKQFHQAAPRNFALCKVIASAYPVTATITATWTGEDGLLNTRTITRVVTNANAFTMMSGFLAEDWQIEVQTNVGSVQAVRLVKTAEDFKSA
jgi:hypothetical protein